MASEDEERAERAARMRLGQAILDLCLGEREDIVFDALTDATATLVGGLTHRDGGTLGDATAEAIRLSGRLMLHIHKHWGALEIGEPPAGGENG